MCTPCPPVYQRTESGIGILTMNFFEHRLEADATFALAISI